MGRRRSRRRKKEKEGGVLGGIEQGYCFWEGQEEKEGLGWGGGEIREQTMRNGGVKCTIYGRGAS